MSSEKISATISTGCEAIFDRDLNCGIETIATPKSQ
jgi:hypothetical protein